LTLAVNDESNPPVEDTMTIDVYDDACKAAIGAGATYDPSDTDKNCITDVKDLGALTTSWPVSSNLEDYAALAAKWLVDYALTAPVPKP
jgi:hypothetical protein